MEYRELGATGCQVGVIGLGCEYLDRKPYEQVEATIEAALGCGVNIFDVFMPGAQVRGHIAKALGGRRKDVMIQGHFCSAEGHKQYDIKRDLPTVRKYFEEILRIFGGYIDFGMMFFIDSEADYQNVFETELIDYALRLKEQGDVGHIGFSSHNPVTAMKAIETGVPELMMFSINPAFDMLPPAEYVFDHFEEDFGAGLFKGIDPRRAELYKLCSQRRVGVTVMKSLGAGKLLQAGHTPFARPLTVAQCIHYALSRPAVASALVGCQTPEEVAQAAEYLDLDDPQRDYAEILGSVRNDFRGNCVYCSHCQPCPAEIDIAAVNKYLDVARLDAERIPPSIRSHYMSLSRRGGDCLACGSCEERCPFGVPVAERMKEAAMLFGS